MKKLEGKETVRDVVDTTLLHSNRATVSHLIKCETDASCLGGKPDRHSQQNPETQHRVPLETGAA